MIKLWRRFGVRTGALLTVLLAVTLTTSEQADAATHVVKDTRRDVYAIKGDDGQHLVNKTGANGDITAVRTNHRARSVEVVIKARQLRGSNATVVEIATSAKHRPTFFVVALKTKRHHDISLTKNFDQQIHCNGLRVRRDVKEAVIRVHIPRRCLDNPQWIRTGVGVFMLRVKGAGRERIDVAGKRLLTDRWFRGVARFPLSPKITAGP
ncbi:hypothetical protein [Microlunatus soli]|uniref:Uncharacterized protein n=1 Tax=Microlunatus soli TaxID=630515 RepID=A0A1H1ZP09_9ACTN|nr:hypothetical protein [Microlunatus soli]SDT34966.1 hypothetical protein SAMN04489812_5325 [Microlunatus soli]